MGYGIIPREIQSSTDPFADASLFTFESNEFITSQIEAINGVATDTLSTTLSTIDALRSIGDNLSLPEYDTILPILDSLPPTEFELPDIPYTNFGRVEDFNVGNSVNTGNLPTIGTVTVPTFSPTRFTLNYPEVPESAVVTTPGDAPSQPILQFPQEITIGLPDQPQFAPITIPTFTVPTIPDFDPTFPTFDEHPVNTVIPWTEPTYSEEVIDEVITQIHTFLAGGSGIRPDIEESIFARGRDREDRVIRQQEQQATGEWAVKGYTAPPGMLVKRLDNIREEGTLKKLSLNREATIKVFDTEVENLRFAVQQGIAAEQLYVQIYLAGLERLFEVAKLSVEWQMKLYELAIQVFTMQMEEVKVRASVYETQVRAAMFEIEVFKALIEGEKAKADMNKTLVDKYVAEVSAREALVRMYSEQVKAVGVHVDVFRAQIEGYKGEVDAYAAQLAADKNKFDAYEATIRGEGIKANVLAAEASAYQAQVQGVATGVQAEVAALEGAVKGIEVQVRNYEATIRGLIGKAEAQLGQIQANVAGNTANTQRYIAKVGAEEARAKVELAAWEGQNRVNMESFKASIASFQAKLERAVKEIELLINSQNAAGGLASTITAGALSAMHVGASLSSNSGVSASGSSSYSSSSSESVSCSTSNTSSITYEADAPMSHDCPSFTDDGF